MFYVTYPDHEQAKDMVQQLINEQLIACGNIFPIDSFYMWKDELHKDAEYVSIMKTTYKNAAALESFIEDHHSYDVPCIIRWEVHSNASYEAWLKSNVKD